MKDKYNIDVPCVHPGCETVMRRSPYRTYKHDLCPVHLAPLRNQDPEHNARRKASLKQLAVVKPHVLAARHRASGEALRKRLREDPELLERYRQLGRQVGEVHGGFVPADTRKRAEKVRATMLGHIPVAFRGEYMALKSTKLPAAERTRIILDQVETVTRRHHASPPAKREGGPQ